MKILKSEEYWPNGDKRTETIRFDSPDEIEPLKGHPNVYRGDHISVPGKIRRVLGDEYRVVSAILTDTHESARPEDPVGYAIIGSTEKEPEKQIAYERFFEYDERERMLSSSIRIYYEGHLFNEMKAEYDPETGEREKTIQTSADWNERRKELTETKTEYDKYFIPREKYDVYTRDAVTGRDQDNNDVRIAADLPTDRQWFIGPADKIAEIYRRLMDMGGVSPSIYEKKLQQMDPKKEYAIETDGFEFYMYEAEDPDLSIKGDKVVDRNDETEYFGEISRVESPLPFRPEAQMILVMENPKNIYHIETPSKEAQLLAAEKDPSVLAGINYSDSYGDSRYKNSPIQDKKLLMEILQKDPASVIYMRQQIEKAGPEDEALLDAVEEAVDSLYEGFYKKEGVLGITDSMILLYSNAGTHFLPPDVSREDLERLRKIENIFSNPISFETYIVSPSRTESSGYDVKKYGHNNKEVHLDSIDMVVDMVRNNMESFSLKDIEILEDIREKLLQKEGPAKAKEETINLE